VSLQLQEANCFWFSERTYFTVKEIYHPFLYKVIYLFIILSFTFKPYKGAGNSVCSISDDERILTGKERRTHFVTQF